MPNGDPRRLTVSSVPKWVDSGLDVAAGQTLHITARGRWRDSSIDTGPAGFDAWWLVPVQWMRRVPHARWFALCGAVGQDLPRAFVIGEGAVVTSAHSGRLWLFANDADFAYGNNSGAVEVQIRVE